MREDNFEQLKEQLYKKGFGESLYQELEQQLKSEKAEFFLEHSVKIKEDDVAYRLHFRRDDDAEKDKVYFNSFDAMIHNSPDLREGEIRQHNFLTRQLISATEAHRMLKYGELVAVNKDLFNKEGQSYNAWLNLDITGPKDEYNNYKVNSYHTNYYKERPFILSDALQAITIPVKFLDNPKIAADFEKSLKKANLVAVTVKLNGEETPAFLSVDAKAGKVNLLDSKLDLIEELAPVLAQKNSGQQQDLANEKKKTGAQQKVNWNKPAHSKGQRP